LSELNEGPELQRLLVEAVREHNVLPLTGRCNLSCCFCSHRFNPPGTRAYSFGPLSAERLSELAAFLDPERKIIIGESATLLREGEPLTHPRLMDLLKELRTRYPETMIQITTNGSLLDHQIIDKFPALQPLELIISVNSMSAKGRRVLMGDLKPAKIRPLLELLAARQLDFHGSIVAMPHLIGFEDLRQTILFLDQCGAKSIRLLIPGFTKVTDPNLIPGENVISKCYQLIAELQRKISTPLLPEPPLINDLHPVVAGVFKGSPAGLKGVKAGDQILDIDGTQPFSRVEAFRKLVVNSDPYLSVGREGKVFRASLPKAAQTSPGLAFDYDLDPDQVDRVMTNVNPNGKTLVLVSVPALIRWQLALSVRSIENINLLAVPSVWFGGTINCAGLLTVSDYREVLTGLASINDYKWILVPGISFDRGGLDLTGQHYLTLTDGGLTVKLID
jgi:NifB/MoaA-like Fe-S oxidoreductase